MKGVHQHILDFEIIETGNLKTIVFIDSSQYMENPESPLLEITIPGTNKYLLVAIQPRKVNTFNSNTLNLTPYILNDCDLIDLPDGVYSYKYKICPYQYINRAKYYLRATKLLNSLDIFLDSFEFSDKIADEDRSTIIDINILIESAKASAELGNTERASNKYHLADKKVKSLLDKLKTKSTWDVAHAASSRV